MDVTWSKIIGRAGEGRFGDLKIKKLDGTTQRGPVTGVRMDENGMIVFNTIWMASKEHRDDNWKSTGTVAIVVSAQCDPWFKQDGTLYFGNANIGQFQLFQKHTTSLEPHEVQGLEPDEVRKSRAWMYDIPLDSTWEKIVERVVHDLGADGLVDSYDQIRVQEEAAQFANA